MNSNLQKIKIVILIAFTVCAVAIYSFDTRLQGSATASSDGAGGGVSSAPGEADCTDCHDQNTLTGAFTISPPANYTPGQTYAVQVEHTTSDMSRLRWGFEMTALTAGNVAAGTFADTTGFTTSFSDSGRNYVDHTSAGSFDNTTGGAVWNFNWTAPATDVGPITFYAAGLQANSANGNGGDQTYTTSQQIPVAPVIVPDHDFSDFDGDGRADPGVFRASEGNWYIRQSTDGDKAINWGLASDLIAPADFDGDNKTDFAVWREGPPAVAAFYILESATNAVRVVQFGQTGDDPAPVGDWDGDGRADVAVYREAPGGGQSYFFFNGSLNNPGQNTTYLPWGTTGDRPVRGDFDGDGKSDLAVFRPADGNWFIRQSSNGQLRVDRWGIASDTIVSGDFDGDAKTDLTVFRNGVWYIKRSSNGAALYRSWGVSGDVLVPADYDGDGTTDVAVYRNGIWWINRSADGSTVAESFGVSTDKPIASFNVR
ncbi:MAG: FG-GAP-like repeat-containing protein [Acidobacteriota bacterium]|nr:FG-GAP-like repeat-containing protein [Acidobacteriota bacterium]MDH3529165.1 FG-GAP-like repeat-containing protein [Acidobacteriota bacterium]